MNTSIETLQKIRQGMHILMQIMIGSIALIAVGMFCCGWWLIIPVLTVLLMASAVGVSIVEVLSCKIWIMQQRRREVDQQMINEALHQLRDSGSR